MSKFDRIALSLMCCAAFYALWLAAPRQTFGADGQVRYVQRDKETGEYEEGTRSVSVSAMTADGVAVEYESKGEKKSAVLPAEQILWLQYEDEPLNLSAARVEIQVGNYEDALEKLGAIEEEIKEPAIQQELEWNRAYATLQSALADSGKLESAAAVMKTFVEAYPDHYRFYEGNALLADAAAALGRAPAAEKYYTALTGAKSASYQARGKVGLANLALDANELDKAKSLFSEVADMAELDGQLAGFDARAAAQIGLARVLSKQGDLDGALASLNALLDATPNSATRRQAIIYNALGDVYAAAKKPEEAIVAYLHVDLLYPAARGERVKALKALVGLWREIGRTDRAVETKRLLRDRFNVDVDAQGSGR
ncbi:MAG: tetratricopeptide repeat protein [Thermoguttaceae bacterium]|nr:tetratricopeptide repeat protein [Thermoguttaceae bacterium]